MASLAF